MRTSVLLRAAPVLAAVLLLGAGCGGTGDPPRSESRRGDLQGTLLITAGRCAPDGSVDGSWFRVTAGETGASAARPVLNPDSPCTGDAVTPLSPGTDGGLRPSRYQPAPTPPFDAAGDATAARIILPVRFRGSRLGLSTNPRDLQAKTEVPPPRLWAEGRVLRGDLRSVDATWAGSFLNVGAPKPDGSRPSGTVGPQGAFDAATGAFTLEWASPVVGGELGNTTVIWHLEGRFEAF